MEQVSKKRVPCSYRKAWEAVPWVKGVNDDPRKAFCSLCCRTFSISHGGYNDLTRHEKRRMHRELSKESSVSGTPVVTSTSEIAAEADSTVVSNGTRRPDCVEMKMHLGRTREETTTKNVFGRSTAGEGIVSALPTGAGACQYAGVSHFPSQGVPASRLNKVQTLRARNICPPLKDLLSSLRMWVPPLRLLSASIWQVVQQRQVQSYNRVEEFVSVVLDLVPDLLSTEEKIELLIGLRTKFALDSCHHAPFMTVKMMLSHLDRVSRIAEIASSDGDMVQKADAAVKEFKELIQGLVNSPAYRTRFFQEIYPLRYGPSYDAALQLLVWEFLSRLEELLPVPSFHQAVSLFEEDPLLLEEFLQMGDDLQLIQDLLLHRKHFTYLLSAPHEPHSSQNRPDMFMTADCSADVDEGDRDIQRDSDEESNTASQHDQQVDTGQSSQTSNGLSSSPYIVVNWSGDNDDDDDDVDEGGDSQRDSDKEASGISQHDQQGDMQRTLNEEKQKEINGCMNDDEMTLKIQNGGMDPSPSAVSTVIPDNNDVGLSLPSKHDNVSLKVDLEKNTNAHTKEDHVAAKMSANGPPHPCSMCGKTYTRKHDLKRHLRIHTGEKPCVCSDCGQRFRDERALTKHVKTHPGELHADCRIDCERIVHDRSEESESPSTEGSRSSTQQATLQKVPAHLNKQAAKRPRKYTCIECDKVFTSSSDLKSHQILHTRLRPHACPHCDKTFQQKAGLAKHLNIHTGNRPFECPSCRKKFYWDSVLIDHLVRHTECMMDCERMIDEQSEVKDPPSTEQSRLSTLQATLRKAHKAPKYPCSTCGKVFLRPSGLALHQRIHTRERPHPCSYCGKTFRTKYILQAHTRTHTGHRPHECLVCGKRFTQHSQLTSHKRLHTGEKYPCIEHLNIHRENLPFECPSCRKKFFRDAVLVDHLGRHTECMMDCERMINEQSEDKDHPSTEQSRLYTLQATLRKAHKAPKYPCSTCGKVFLRPYLLTEHQKIHTGEKPHSCSYCRRTFRTKLILQMHIRTHTGHRPHKCSVCEKCFSQQSQLIAHTRIHTGEKPYLCSFCGKTFNHVGGLYSHTRTHTGERSHQCEFCNKTFSNSGTLNVHRRVHTKEKPFLCTLCPKRFPCTSGLKRHMRTHTGEKPFMCLKCGKTFSETGNLKVHQRVHR